MIARPLVLLDDALEAACAGGTVVAANQRLKRHVKHAWNARQVARGLKVWRSAPVESLDEWLANRYRQLRAAGDPGAARRILDPSGQRLLWMHAAPPGASAHAAALYALARPAWETLHAYRLDGRVPDFGDNENTRLFRDWIGRYRAAASERWLTSPELSAALVPYADRMAANIQGPVILIGFEPPTPALQALVEALAARDVDCRFHRREPRTPREPTCVRCATPDAELGEAAAWARALLLAAGDEPLAIGIAVPEVIGRYDALTRQLDATLNPHRLDDDPRDRAYDISGGMRLNEHACVAAALKLLQFLVEPQPPTTVAMLLRSPFFGFQDVDLPIPEWLPGQFTFATLANAILGGPVAASTAAKALRAVQGRLASAPRMASLTDWSDHFRACLVAAAWPTHAEDSVTHQAADAFREVLDEAACVRVPAAVFEAPDALTMIQGLSADRLFAPRRPHAPIQIVSYSEIRTLTFTHLWVIGLTDRDWPGSPHPNPFLPLRLQREAGVPHCDSQSQFAHARQALEEWRVSADDVVFSAAQRDGDELLEPTHLIPADRWRAPVATPACTHPFLVPVPVPLEVIADSWGPRAERVVTRGSAALRDQAQCPFRGFAVHRLGAQRVDEPHSFPDARERGILVHEALQTAYARIDAREALRALTPAERAALANQAARAAIERWARRFPLRVRRLEAQRIAGVLREWLAFDAERPPFRVLQREATIETTAGGLPLRLRVDRIDEVPGGRVVIDYKTGATDLRGWDPDGLTEPQLPLYAQSVANTTAVIYARVSPERQDVAGVAADPTQVAAPGAKVHEPSLLGVSTWADLREAWRARLVELGEAFIAGDARVAPRHPSVCTACNLHPLCRVGELDDRH